MAIASVLPRSRPPRALAARYALPSSLPRGGTVAWASAIRAVWAPRLGTSPAGRTALQLLPFSLKKSTADKYGYKFRQFVEFCQAEDPPLTPLPATGDAVLRYVGHIALAGRVRAENLQQYFSAINKVHTDLGYTAPALGTDLRVLCKALAIAQQELYPTDARLALPAGVVLSALRIGFDVAVRVLRDSHLGAQPADADVRLFRACVLLVWQFLTMNRPATAAAIRRSDVRIQHGPEPGVLLRYREEKQRSGEPECRNLFWPRRYLLGPFYLLQLWLQFGALHGETVSTSASRFLYQLPPAWHESAPSSASIGSWTCEAVAAAGFTAPAGSTVSGYCTRKGGATAAHSVGVQLSMIKHYGGWAIGSNVVHDYIDRAVPPSAAAELFFGWLNYGLGTRRPEPQLHQWLPGLPAGAWPPPGARS